MRVTRCLKKIAYLCGNGTSEIAGNDTLGGNPGDTELQAANETQNFAWVDIGILVKGSKRCRSRDP